MTLGRCLEALRLNQKNKSTTQVIPYRESKVTHMFRDALHGYGNVVLSVNVSPSAADFDETLRVLKYAMTASQIATTTAKPIKPSQMTNTMNSGPGAGNSAIFHVGLPLIASDVSGSQPPMPTTAAAVPTKQGRLRKETPLGLKRHRQLMEMGRRHCREGDIVEVSVSIDSRIQGASPSPMLPQLLCEEEIDNTEDADDRGGGMWTIQEQALESSGVESGQEEEAEEETEDEEDGGVTMRGGKPVRGFPRGDDSESEKDAVIARLKRDLEIAEGKLHEVEAEVRDEVATEMTQIIDTVEETYKQQIEDNAKAAESRIQEMESRHEKELEDMEATIESQQRELDELRATLVDLERRASKRRKKVIAAEEDAQRYKSALNDALAEIEKLHGIIEQEEEANAKLAASLSEVLREQSLPDSPEKDIRDSEGGHRDAAAAKIKRIKREVTQIEANNAMEKDMSEHLIERLKKDNEMLRSKLAAMTNAIESCCTPSRNAVIQNLVTACPAGLGRGAVGTPHDVALARARRLLDSGSPAADESPKDSMTKSRFAKEAHQGGSESPKTIGRQQGVGDIRGLRPVGDGEEIQPIEPLKTSLDGASNPSPPTRSASAKAKLTLRRSPRRSPRKHLSSAGDEAPRDETVEDVEKRPESPELPKTETRVTRRTKKKDPCESGKKAVDSTPAMAANKAAATAPKTRKLLSTTSKQTPMRMLGVSNSAATSKRSRRQGGGLPTAEDLGFKT